MPSNLPFKVGMKLEADEIKFSNKICVATIGDIIDGRLLITFDGMDRSFNYWADGDSPHIHPINWHKQERLTLQAPPGKYFMLNTIIHAI